MKVRVLKCDGCNKILDENPDGGALDGFTSPELDRRDRGEWPDNLFHLCPYCTFRAKVLHLKRLQETRTKQKARYPRIDERSH